jgi:NAD-dependent dihydropyrimidine dehydrogenase PreA subunit
MAHKQPGYRFENDWSLEEMREDTEKAVQNALVIPIGVEINADNTVLNLDTVKKYLTEAKTIALMNCSCKTKRNHCNSPRDVCIALNGWAEHYLVSDKNTARQARRVDVDEAFDALKRGNEAGLVLMAYIYSDNRNDGNPDAICSCCSCCCSILGGTLRMGLAPHLLKASAKSEIDKSKCVNCGTCVERCHFGARKMVDGKMVYNKDLCFGCGLCVSTCPKKAISLTQFG